MVRDALKLLFLITSYNFILYYISNRFLWFPWSIFPEDPQDMLILFSINSALYLSWLFGYKGKTVVWIGYISLFQILGFAIVREDPYIIPHFVPSLLLTLSLIWLFESPVEKRTRELEEAKKKLEEEILRNQEEQIRLREQIELSRELTERILKDKEKIERELKRLKEEEAAERESLEREREELSQALLESQKRLQEYMERLERITKVNRELFQMLELMQEREPKGGKEELARLRQERKRLSKELVQMQELLEELSKENAELNRKYTSLFEALEREKRERELLSMELERLRGVKERNKEIYQEVLEAIFDNLEFEDRALKDFIDLDFEAKGEFVKELMLLNMKGIEERFESMRGYRNVFKLKPRGGRIYFTFGDRKRWKIIGMLWGEDEKAKNRFAKERLVKYKE
ncbi:MAG: hypothetical protein ACK4VK_03800 [Aquificaceae bacterium]